MSQSTFYNENDGYIGFWILDQPYVPSELPYPEGGRKYQKFLTLSSHLKPHSSNVYKYFESIAPLQGDIYMNGRKFYDIKWSKSHPNSEIKISIYKPEEQISICKSLSPFKNVDINISSLICTQFGKKMNTWAELFDLLKRCDLNSDCYECTNVSHKIASSLVKVASLRIFATPEQSILELPVNSIDSYHPDMRIGKFGMGFFSFLYWLIGHPNRVLYIYSWFFDNDLGNCGYCVTIKDTNDGLAFNLRILDTNVKRTGTFIYLDASNDEFENYNIVNFANQLEKLMYVKNVRIFKVMNNSPYTGEDTRLFSDIDHFNLVNDHQEESVFIVYGRNRITIEDYAQGIPINVLLGSLFVPSISTKTIQEHQKLDSKWVQNIIPSEPRFKRTFIIMVGGIIVVRIEIPSNDENDKYDGLVIDMPPTTKLPVSRDDIILNNATYKFFSDGIINALEYGLENGNTKRIELYLRAYQIYTVNIDNRSIIANVLNDFYNKNVNVLVTSKFRDQVNGLFPGFVTSTYMNVKVIEKRLLETNKYRTDIWFGKKVVFVKERISHTHVNSYGMLSLIFVEESFTKNVNWIDLCTDSNPQLHLTPIGVNYGEEIIDFYKTQLPEELQSDLFFGLYGYFEGLSAKLNIKRDDMGIFLRHLWDSYYDLNDIEDIAYALIDNFIKFEPKDTYGRGMGNFILQLENFYSWSLFEYESISKKLISYRIEVMLLYIMNLEVYYNANYILDPYKYYHPDGFIHTFSLELCNTIAEISHNVNEFFILMMVYRVAFMKNKNIKKFIYKPAIDSIIKHIRELGYGKVDVNRTFHGDDSFSYSEMYIKLSSELIEWYSMLVNYKPILPYDPNFDDNSLKAITTTSKFIGYLFHNNSTDFWEIINGSDAFKGQNKFQMLEIAINEGTTKEFVSAVITELVQNSVDAIRMTNNKNKNIEINFFDNNESFYIEITDYVGIPPNGLTSLSIPFLSTKGHTELATGEMGTGFFNVYRESKSVVIDTIYNGTRYVIADKPIIRNGRVVDINRLCIKSDTNESNRTKIQIRTNNLPQDKIAEYLGYARYSTHRVMSLVTLFNDINLKVNNELIKINKNHIFTYDFYDVYISNDSTSISYLLTNGIPYAPLTDIMSNYNDEIRQLASNQIIINIRHGGYTPVQTRTKINMPPLQWRKFNDILEFSILGRILHNSFDRNSDFILNFIYPEYTSEADAQQLKSTNKSFEQITDIYNIRKKYFYYLDLNIWRRSEMSLQEIGRSSVNNTVQAFTNLLINELGSDFPKNPIVKLRIKNFIDRLDVSPFEFFERTIKKLLEGWIMYKNSDKSSNSVGLSAIANIPDEDDPELYPYIRIWINTYCDIAIKENINLWTIDSINEIRVIKSSSNNASGWYSPQTKNITINTIFFRENERTDFINKIKSINHPSEFRIIDNPIYKRIFGYKFPSSTCPHELEHARNTSSHEGAHAPVRLSLWEDDIEHERTFDQAVNDVYSKILSSGFYPELFKRYKEAGLIN